MMVLGYNITNQKVTVQPFTGGADQYWRRADPLAGPIKNEPILVCKTVTSGSTVPVTTSSPTKITTSSSTKSTSSMLGSGGPKSKTTAVGAPKLGGGKNVSPKLKRQSYSNRKSVKTGPQAGKFAGPSSKTPIKVIGSYRRPVRRLGSSGYGVARQPIFRSGYKRPIVKSYKRPSNTGQSMLGAGKNGTTEQCTIEQPDYSKYPPSDIDLPDSVGNINLAPEFLGCMHRPVARR